MKTNTAKNHMAKLRIGASPLIAIGALFLGAMGASLHADPVDDKLTINGEIEIVTKAALPEHMSDTPIEEIMSGWLYRTDETRAMSRDDFDNPAMAGVEAAREQFAKKDGSEGKACADCHESPEKFAGLRPLMPKVNDKGELWSLENYINDCRTNRMGAEGWGWNDGPMVDMTALISSVSRGMPVNVAIDGPAAPFWEKGKELYYTRFGQLEMSCASCHELNNGKMIRADHLSQGQINGFPTYRLKNAKLNSSHARFKGCVRDTRAETFKPGSDEFRALELYVASRGNGLSVEGPSVRN